MLATWPGKTVCRQMPAPLACKARWAPQPQSRLRLDLTVRGLLQFWHLSGGHHKRTREVFLVSSSTPFSRKIALIWMYLFECILSSSGSVIEKQSKISPVWDNMQQIEIFLSWASQFKQRNIHKYFYGVIMAALHCLPELELFYYRILAAFNSIRFSFLFP